MLVSRESISKDGVELIGPEDNLIKATVITSFSLTAPEVAERAGKHIGGIRQILLPNWTDGTTWLTDSLKAAFKAENGGDYSTTVDGRLVSMNVITFGPTSAVVTFSISPAP